MRFKGTVVGCTIKLEGGKLALAATQLADKAVPLSELTIW